MAEVVLGLGTSHGPQLNIPPTLWELLHDKDKTDPRIDYQALLKVAPNLEEELTPRKYEERFEACHTAMGRLRRELEAASPDVIVVVGDDQHEQFLDDNMPMFSVFCGSSMQIVKRRRPDAPEWIRAEEEGTLRMPEEAPAAQDLGGHLIDYLRNNDFDVASCAQLKPSVGLGHAFSFLYRYIHPEAEVPMVPVMVNTFFPPNQPTPRRCYALGEALREAIESWESDKRVAVVASGGLSHTIIEEDLDRATLKALEEKDGEALCSLPMRRLTRGTSEIRNWITLGAAFQKEAMHLVDYVPCYRSPASTGCAMAFAYWE
jgi:hypothetical protein